MQKLVSRLVLFALLISVTHPLMAAEEGLVGWWKFDDIRTERRELEMVRGETFLPKEVFGFVKNSVNNNESDLNGKFFKQVKGVRGGAVLLDGNTAFIEVNEDDVPRITGDFSVEAWIALGAYPNNLCPIVDNQRDPAEGYFNGYFFGLDALGRLILRIATDGRDEEVVGTKTIPLYTWTQISGTYSSENGMKIYVNGQLASSKKPNHEFTPSQEWVNILIGKSRARQRPYGTIRPYGTQPFDMFYDGLVDELKVYDTELSAQAVKKSYSALKTNAAPELPERKMPTGPLKSGVFAAINTNLKFYEAYDALWHVDKGCDVVVRFDEYPCEFVFWKGANYQAHLVTEKGYWFNNGFNEGWNEHGSCEPMSDKQARHSVVKVLENNEARIVVQWRYALVDNWYQFAFFDPATGRGDWTNETYYIYPDMVAVREDVLLSNAPRAEHEWQESMVVPGPGQAPADLLEYAALTLGNDKGEFHTYSWEHKTPPHLPPLPKNPNIQLVNMKSKYKPFSILRPQDDPSIDIYSGEIRRQISVFPWWNHWPVAQKPTDGRWAMFADRPSHSSLSHWFWEAYDMTDRSMTKLMLTGMTDKTAEQLLPLARSWYSPPQIKKSANLKARYDQAQRAYILSVENESMNIEFNIVASKESPVVNPAFVIRDWGNKDLSLKINGREISRGKNFRYGRVDKLESSDLVVWIRYESMKPVQITLSSRGA
jgi:hypothetical protein